MKFSRYISFLFILLTLIFTSACVDDLLYDGVVIGEGEADVNLKVEFHSLEPALGTRSAGNAVDRVDKLWVVLYNVKADGTEVGLYEKIRIYDSASGYTLPGFTIDQGGNSDNPGDSENVKPSGNENVGPNDGTIGDTGEKTPTASFSLSNIPYGRYKIFAVANVDLTNVDCTTIDDLCSQRFEWKENVSLNSQMFGYFTSDEKGPSAGFNAPMLVVNQKSVSFHSWIKRLVSKVTVSFDGSDLKENIRIYIKSVTIHDIPASCALGKDNSADPEKGVGLITNGESFTFYNEGEGSDSNHENWNLYISKGNSTGGQSKHTESDPALYFYENLQGDYQGDALKDKRQDPNAVGTPIDKPEDGADYKDSELYGTYIEVVGYYDSRNKDKISQGPIRYRFMLGKNSTFNYNAERNYHYKLTLKFRGWANEADWHISYREYSPTFITPEPYYISYLYGQELDFPARVILSDDMKAEDVYIKAEIVENNWFPWDRTLNNGKGGQPAGEVGGGTNINGFAWNTGSLDIYKHIPYDSAKWDGNPYKGGNYVGFLSLRPNEYDVIGTNTQVKDFTGNLDPKGYGTNANSYLENYYKANNLAINTYELTGQNANYDLVDKSIRVKIPMYTRNKEMVPKTDFTGNNPYNCYYRYAKVRFTLWQRGAGEGGADKQIRFKNEEGEWDSERLSTIYQVLRIENPKAIYRDANNDEEFEVKLMIAPTADAETFQQFKSDGPWRAYVECQTETFVELYDSLGVKRDTIKGSTDQFIVFKYKPGSKIGDDKTRSGIIRVDYNDYNCTHLIFVRQGYHVGVQLGDAKWSCYNVYATSRGGTNPDRGNRTPSEDKSVPVALTKNPLSVGSLLKRNNYNYSIREANVSEEYGGYGWLISVTGKDLTTAYIKEDNTVDTRTAKWDEIQGYGWTNYASNDNTAQRYDKTWADTWTAVGGFRNGEEFTVPTAENYKSLLANCKFGYGIVYADGATTTRTSLSSACGFTDYDNDGFDDAGASNTRGVRACVVYDEKDGRNIIFPLSSIGMARRSRLEPSNISSNPPFGKMGVGTLCYSNLREVLSNSANRYRPNTYNNYRNSGAIYWIKTPVTIPGTSDGKLHLQHADYASWDINYFTVMFNPYDHNSLGGWDEKNNKYDKTGVTTESSSDALPIKLIYK